MDLPLALRTLTERMRRRAALIERVTAPSLESARSARWSDLALGCAQRQEALLAAQQRDLRCALELAGAVSGPSAVQVGLAGHVGRLLVEVDALHRPLLSSPCRPALALTLETLAPAWVWVRWARALLGPAVLELTAAGMSRATLREADGDHARRTPYGVSSSSTAALNVIHSTCAVLSSAQAASWAASGPGTSARSRRRPS